MIKSIAALASVLLLTLQLTGCVGGGATGSANPSPGTAVPTIEVSLTDSVTGVSLGNSPTISSGKGATATATVRDAGGAVVAGKLVEFTITDPTKAKFQPESQSSALTDSVGVARIKIDAATLSSSGATTLTAKSLVKVVGEDVEATGTRDFGIGPANVTLADLTANLPAGTSTLSPYATTSITVSVVGVSATTPVTVSFSSSCASSGKATLTPTAITANGVATATYADGGCARNDSILATIAGSTTSASLTLPVSAPSAAAIQFVSASNSLIALKGTGTTELPESSLVTFKLVDNNNVPIPNANITFDVTTRTGGILLDSSSSAITKQTNSNGLADVSISSGSVPTPVSVIARYNSSLSSQSIRIQISTGLPVQDRLSLSIEKLNIDGFYIDGIKTKVNVIASDRVGNPVRDGTEINFFSSGGQIGTQSKGVCLTEKGTCSVEFTSSNPRPNKGRIAILAYAAGEEPFFDTDGNNSYDHGEPFTDLGDAFVDTNLDLAKNDGELQFNYVLTGKQSCASKLTGATLPRMVSDTCDGKWGQAHVRDTGTLVLSGRTLNIKASSPSTALTTASTTVVEPVAAAVGPPVITAVPGQCVAQSVTFKAYDENDNPLPEGTTLTVGNLPQSGWKAEIVPSKVPNTNNSGGSIHVVTFTPTETCPTVRAFSATIIATTPSATSTAESRIAVSK